MMKPLHNIFKMGGCFTKLNYDLSFVFNITKFDKQKYTS